MMCMKQSKEEQLKIIQEELQKSVETFQLPTWVLCNYLRVMVEYGLSKPNIYDYFTEFPVSDVLNECRAIIDQLMDEHPSLRESAVNGTTLGKVMALHQDAIGIDTFMETYLDLPIQNPVSYLTSIEDMMNCARQSFDIVDFAYWWSVWNITKVKGSLDNLYWENRNRFNDRVLLGTLNEFLDIQMVKDSQGNYVYDIFKNPSAEGQDWVIPCEVLLHAIKCLKHFIDLDDLPQA